MDSIVVKGKIKWQEHAYKCNFIGIEFEKPLQL